MDPLFKATGALYSKSLSSPPQKEIYIYIALNIYRVIVNELTPTNQTMLTSVCYLMLNLVLHVRILLLSIFWSYKDTIWVLSSCSCYRSLKLLYHLTWRLTILWLGFLRTSLIWREGEGDNILVTECPFNAKFWLGNNMHLNIYATHLLLYSN